VSFHFERSIVFWDNNSPLLGGCHSASILCEINLKLDHNLYWNAAGKPPVFPRNLNLDQWRERNQDRPHLSPIRSWRMPTRQLPIATGFASTGRRVPAFDAIKTGRREPPLLTMDFANCASNIPIRTYRP
jgi:hypothetical protein